MMLLQSLAVLIALIQILDAKDAYLRNLINILNMQRKEFYDTDDTLDEDYYLASDVKQRDADSDSDTETSSTEEDRSTTLDLKTTIQEETRKVKDPNDLKYYVPLWEEILSNEDELDPSDDISMNDVRYFDVTDYRNRLAFHLGRDKYRLSPKRVRSLRSVRGIKPNDANTIEHDFYSLPEKLKSKLVSRNDNDTKAFLGTADLTTFWDNWRQANNTEEYIHIIRDNELEFPDNQLRRYGNKEHGSRMSEELFWKPLKLNSSRRKPTTMTQVTMAPKEIVEQLNDVYASASSVMAKAVTKPVSVKETQNGHVLFSNMGLLGLWGELGSRANLRSMKNDIGPLDMWQSTKDETPMSYLTKFLNFRRKQFESNRLGETPKYVPTLHDRSQKAHAYENTYIRDELFKKVRVLCWVPTSARNHKTKAIHLKRTWGQRCNTLLIFSDSRDKELETTRLLASKGPMYLWNNTKKPLDYIYEHHKDDYDWVLKADDDTYVILENLRYLLTNYSADEPLHLGSLYQTTTAKNVTVTVIDNGAYVLSKEAVRRFVLRRRNCERDILDRVEITISDCLNNLHVKAVNLVDSQNRTTILSQDLNGENVQGMDCCSDYMFAFINVNAKGMYMMEYLVYHARPFGIQYELPEKDYPDVLKLNIKT